MNSQEQALLRGWMNLLGWPLLGQLYLDGADIATTRQTVQALRQRLALKARHLGLPELADFWLKERLNGEDWLKKAEAGLRTLLEAQEPQPALDDSVITEKVYGHVLVAEDNLTNQKVIGYLLKKLHVQVNIVDNGQEAVDAITGGMRPDLLLMDMQMPVLDGIQATQRIRQMEKDASLPHLPIIALTAGAFEDDRENCIAAGMDDFMTKPIGLNILKTMLAKWLNKPKDAVNF